jgi:hypothetical protein|eukprot:COSAG02_NODE_5440_length_4328_cov_4.242374_4_plen_135_part_00
MLLILRAARCQMLRCQLLIRVHVCSCAHRMVIDRVVRRMATKAGLRQGFDSWLQVTADNAAKNRRAHKVTSKMLRYRYSLIFRLWHGVAADLARQHRVCRRALSVMYRRRAVDCFGRWASFVHDMVEESRQQIR